MACAQRKCFWSCCLKRQDSEENDNIVFIVKVNFINVWMRTVGHCA